MTAKRKLLGTAALLIAALATPVLAQGGAAHVEQVVALIEQGQVAEAEALARRVLAETQANQGGQSLAVADAYAPLGYALFAQGQTDGAIAAFDARVALYQQIVGPDADGTIAAISELTSALIEAADRAEGAGDWVGAEAALERVLANYTLFRDETDRDALGYRRRLATAIRSQGRVEEAEQLMRRTLDIAEAAHGTGDRLTLDLINDLGRVLEAQGKHDLAGELYSEALEAGRAAYGADDSGVLVYGQNLGASLMYQRRLDEALPVIRDTLERRMRVLGPDAPHTIYSMSDLATALTFGDDLASARPVWEATLAKAEHVFGPAHPHTAQIRNGYAVFLDRAGNDPAQALAEAQLAADMIRARRDVIGLDPRGQRTLASFTETDAFYFELWLHALRQAGDQQDLPQINRIVLFYEAVGAIQEAMESPANMAVIRRAAERAAAVQGPEIAQLASQRQTLGEQWLEVAKRRATMMTGAMNATSLADVQAEQDRIAAEIKLIDERFLAEFPEFFNLLRPRAIDAIELKEMLQGRDEALLIVLPTQFGTHVMAISGTDMDWHVSEFPRPTIDAVVRRLRWDLGASVDATDEEVAEWTAEGEGAYPFDRRLANGLFNQLVAPVEWVLKDKRHVFVVAGGSLSALPFGVLVTETPTGVDGDPAALRNTAWMADKYALAQLPSVQSLAMLRRFGDGEATTNGFLGFGDPVLQGEAQERSGGLAARGAGTRGNAVRAVGFAQAYDASDAIDQLATVNVEALRRMARLPGTGIELEAMREVLGAPASAIMTGARATEAVVKSTDLSRASIITFATHGLLAGEIDGSTEPGLVFTPPQSASAEDDGLLTMTEIAALDMNADWVILSACNTAAGDGASGATGLSGLAKSFFLAGAQSLLASHWPVRDDVAAKLTVDTIAFQRDNPQLSRAEALQKAMQTIRNDTSADGATDSWAHPNAWAPFTLIGDAD